MHSLFWLKSLGVQYFTLQSDAPLSPKTSQGSGSNYFSVETETSSVGNHSMRLQGAVPGKDHYDQSYTFSFSKK